MAVFKFLDKKRKISIFQSQSQFLRNLKIQKYFF